MIPILVLELNSDMLFLMAITTMEGRAALPVNIFNKCRVMNKLTRSQLFHICGLRAFFVRSEPLRQLQLPPADHYSWNDG